MKWLNIRKLNLFSKKQINLESVVNLPGYPSKQSRRMLITLALALVVVSGLAFYFWYQNGGITEIEQARNQNQTEAQKLVAEISQFLILPEGEQPTVATVSDLEALKGQPFFANAQKGNKVLIYTKAKKAILYDPVAKKIVEVAPINLGNSAPQL